MRRIASILIVLGVSGLAAGQEPGIKLQLDTRTLEPGEAADVKLVCTNTGQPEPPQAVVPAGLKLQLAQQQPSRFTQSSWVNGRSSQTATYTYHMRLIAVKEGTYTLGPVSVLADGTKYETEPVTIVVRKPEGASDLRGDRYIFAEIQVEPTSVYVTETYSATLIIGIRKVVIGNRRFDINLLGIIDARRSQLSIFGGRFQSSSRRLTDSNGQQHDYEIFRVTKEIRAEEVGATVIGPVFLKAEYPTRVRRSFFSWETSQSRRETARAEAVTVQVKGPPDENRPPTYNGAIGQYVMKVSAKPTNLEQGQPVTLTVSIFGRPLEGIAGPDLGRHPELASRFDYAKDELLGDLERGAKVFRRAVFPKQQGEQTIPPITWSFFDLKAEEYVTLTSAPISLTVGPPSTTATTITLPNEAEPGTNGTPLTVLAGGISANYGDPGAVLANQTLVLSPPWFAALVLPPGVWLIVTISTRHRARLRADAGFARRRRARRNARSRISGALKKGSSLEQLEGLATALTAYLSDRFNLPPGEVTPSEARALLSERGADDVLADDVSSFLQTCDEARYAPSEVDNLSVSEAAGKARRWVKQIERTTR